MTAKEALRVERLQKALQLAIVTLNETAIEFSSEKASKLNNIAAHCRQQLHQL